MARYDFKEVVELRGADALALGDRIYYVERDDRPGRSTITECEGVIVGMERVSHQQFTLDLVPKDQGHSVYESERWSKSFSWGGGSGGAKKQTVTVLPEQDS